jgi:lysophospholipase L1-like esterase
MKINFGLKSKLLLLSFALLPIVAFRANQKPTLFTIGDSTVKNTQPMYGWGSVIGTFFDTTKIEIANHAMAGRSSRTFLTENRWHKVDSLIKPGDYVMMQFGHNDGSAPDTTKKNRGTLKGTGDETVELVWADGRKETVHTYGWYIRKFVRDTKSKGGIPIVLSMIPRNQWKDGKVLRASDSFGKWAKEVAEQEGAFFIDLNKLTADKYDQMGPDKVKAFFPGDHTHTNLEGATINAASIVEGLKQLQNCTLNNYLLKK